MQIKDLHQFICLEPCVAMNKKKAGPEFEDPTRCGLPPDWRPLLHSR